MVGARCTVYGLIVDRFGPFLDALTSLLLPPSFPLHVDGRLDEGVAGDAVEKAGENVPGGSWIEFTCQYRSSGATTTFVRWNSGGMWGEGNGHVISETD